MANQKVKYDIEGYNAVTSALMELLNQYPALKDGDEITFSVLSEDSGKAMFPVSGAVIETEKKNISECIIAKFRNGSVGTVELGWRGEFTRFTNLEQSH